MFRDNNLFQFWKLYTSMLVVLVTFSMSVPFCKYICKTKRKFKKLNLLKIGKFHYTKILLGKRDKYNIHNIYSLNFEQDEISFISKTILPAFKNCEFYSSIASRPVSKNIWVLVLCIMHQDIFF